MNKSNAKYLQDVIRDNPNTKFVLFHGNYPWTSDLCGLLFSNKNVYIDLCWLPIISTKTAENLLSEILDIGAASKISWGCDTWLAEDSLGALLAVKHVIAKVLSQRIEDNIYTKDLAFKICDSILRNNAKMLYRL